MSRVRGTTSSPTAAQVRTVAVSLVAVAALGGPQLGRGRGLGSPTPVRVTP